MIFGMKVCQYVRSNAVVLVKNGVTLAIGGGQTLGFGRLTAKNNNPTKISKGAVLASDAFFPFPDCVELAHQMGVTAVVQLQFLERPRQYRQVQ